MTQFSDFTPARNASSDVRRGKSWEKMTCQDDGKPPAVVRPRGRLRIAKVCPGLAVAGAIMLVLGFATQASASTTVSGCTVTPRQPVDIPSPPSSAKRARFPVEIRCDGGRTAKVEQQAFEQDTGMPGDSGDDDDINYWDYTWIFYGEHTKTFYPVILVPPFDGDNSTVELYHRVRFKVTSSNGVVGAYTPWESSKVISVALGQDFETP